MLPAIDLVFVTIPLPATEIATAEEDFTVPLFAIVHDVPIGPSTPSAPAPVDVTVPVLVMVSGLSPAARTTGPVILLLIVLAMFHLLSGHAFMHHSAAADFARLNG